MGLYDLECLIDRPVFLSQTPSLLEVNEDGCAFRGFEGCKT
jgi:hypothetical protein